MAVSVEERGEEVSLGAQRELFHLVNPNTFPLGSMFDVTADGQRFLITEAGSLVSGCFAEAGGELGRGAEEEVLMAEGARLEP